MDAKVTLGKASREGSAGAVVSALVVWLVPHVSAALAMPEETAALLLGALLMAGLKAARNWASETRGWKWLR